MKSRLNLPDHISSGTSALIASPSSVLSIATLACSIVLIPLGAQAQWWSRAPADFEECADKAEKVTGKEERKAQLSACNAKFAGRRKPGGGYTYFDFMQNRSFDMAGPNPTPAEQKKIDEQYTAFLAQERQSRLAAEQQSMQRAWLRTEKQDLLQQASLRAEKQQLPQQASLRTEKIPLPAEAPNKRQRAVSDIKPSPPKAGDCTQQSFSCDWPRLSETLNDLKKLFSSSPAKPKRS